MTTLTKEQIEDIYYNDYQTGTAAYLLDEKYHTGKGYFYRWFKRIGLKTRSNAVNSKRYSFDENYFETIDTQDKAYWLGFISADGYILSQRKHNHRKVGVSISVQDRQHLEKLNRCLKSNVAIKQYGVTSGYKIGTQYCRVIYSSEKMADDLIRHGVLEHKSHTIQFPNLPEHLIKDFIRGYFDGNGSIWKQDQYTQFNISIVSTDHMLLGIQDYLLQQNIIDHAYSLDKRKSNQIVSSFKFGGNHLVYRFLYHLYHESNIHLDRKYALYLELQNKVNSHPIQ